MESKANAGNAAVETIEAPAKVAKKTAKSKSKAQEEIALHPNTAEMVNAAIKELKDRKGSSLQAIKKYITVTYIIDGKESSPFIKKYLKSAVTSGAIVQTKGKGASGSFKLSTGKNSENSKVKKVLIPRKKSVTKRSQTVVKKVVFSKAVPTARKTAVDKKANVAKAVAKPKTAIEVKTMSKTKKTTKAPAVKMRSPKPKKVGASRSVRSSPKNKHFQRYHSQNSTGPFQGYQFLYT